MPARLRALVRVLAEHGIAVEEPSKGSHWKAIRGGTVYPIPAHNGPKTEISDVYVRGLCRAFQLDEQAFRAKL